MANKHRRELNATMAGEEYLLRPTFDALAEIEDRSGVTYGKMIKMLMEENLSMKCVPAIIFAGLKGGGSKMSFDEVKELVMDHGILQSTPIAVQFLTLAFSSDSAPKDISRQKKT